MGACTGRAPDGPPLGRGARTPPTLETPMSTPSVDEILKTLSALGDEKVRAQNRRSGAGDDQYGVKLGDIRKVAAKIKADPALASALWQTGNLEARLVAILLIKPKHLSAEELDRMEREVTSAQIADWLNGYVAKEHPEKEALRQRWIDDPHPWVARAGWSLTNERILKDPAGLDLGALLERIASEMGSAPAPVQWTMNFCLGGIGIHFPEHRERAITIGETLGLYRDYPVSKGCTSPFVPIWVNEMVRRQG